MPDADRLDSPDAGNAAVRGGVLRVGGYVVGVLVSVVSAAVLFRHLGVGDAGRYVVVLSTVTLAAGVTDAGLSNIGVRELALRRGADREALMRNLLGLRIGFTLLGMAGACLYAVVAGLGSTLVLGTLIAGAGVLVQNLQNTYATVLMTDLRLGWVSLLDLVRQVLTAVGIVVAATLGATLLPFFVLAPLAGVAVLVATVVMVRRDVPLLPGFDRVAWRALLADTLPFALAAAVGAIYFRLAILLVDLLSTEFETGLFGASFRIVEVLVIIPQLTIGAALPIFARAARDDADRLRYGLGLVSEAMVTLGLALAIGLVAGAPVAIEVVAGASFADAVPVLRLHAVALLFAFAAAPWAYALLSLRRPRDVVVMNLLGLVVLTLLLVALVPDHGARGAAAATIGGELTLALSGTWFVRRSGTPLRLGRLPRVLLAAALGAVPAALLPALPAAVTGLLVYVIALVLLRAIPDELLDASPVALPGRRRA